MKQYNGILVPLVTPFNEKGKIDRPHLEKMIEGILKYNCHPFVMGTTGEGLSIGERERREIITTLAGFNRSGVTLYASVSGTCHRAVIERAKRYADKGVHVMVAHLPPHYTLSPYGMLTWFETLADQSPRPVMLYNIPSTTHMSLPLDIAEKLSRHPNIVGIKDSEKDEQRLRESAGRWKDRADFSHFTGWADRSFDGLKWGSDGLVPSSANLVPWVYSKLYRAVRNGDDREAKNMQMISDQVGQLYQQGRLLPDSLSALKVMMKAIGLCEAFVLPPLNRPGAAEEKNLKAQFLACYSNVKSELD
ncbi:MAG TPA: dihydrodipicolinate synthase family protein [Agriterribacter sp.]|nr:dihydrodipicolinate synthase family protein [Agriterribacter sp.]